MVELASLRSAMDHDNNPKQTLFSSDIIPAQEREPKRDKKNRSYGTGRRKEAIARVWVTPGSGKITVNKRSAEIYFARPLYRSIIQRPLEVVKGVGQYDIYCTVTGGGLSGQADAVRLGVARALDAFDPKAYHVLLSGHGQLKRDSRVVERKKYGQPKARRQWQYSKR